VGCTIGSLVLTFSPPILQGAWGLRNGTMANILRENLNIAFPTYTNPSSSYSYEQTLNANQLEPPLK
jgi:hypothetical protein